MAKSAACDGPDQISMGTAKISFDRVGHGVNRPGSSLGLSDPTGKGQAAQFWYQFQNLAVLKV